MIVYTRMIDEARVIEEQEAWSLDGGTAWKFD